MRKSEELKRSGMARVSCAAKEGFSADEIIAFGRATKDSLIAMRQPRPVGSETVRAGQRHGNGGAPFR